MFKDGVEASGALVVDVRETSEYEEGHIPGAVNIPLRTVTQNLDKIPTDRPVYIYCKSGFRAAQALSALGLVGYNNVLSYRPGWDGWTEAGEEVSAENAIAEVVGAPDIEPELLAAVDGYMSTIPEGFDAAGDAAKFLEAADAGSFVLDVRTAAETRRPPRRRDPRRPPGPGYGDRHGADRRQHGRPLRIRASRCDGAPGHGGARSCEQQGVRRNLRLARRSRRTGRGRLVSSGTRAEPQDLRLETRRRTRPQASQ